MKALMIKAILLDFGGVVAEEGFRDGISAIGEKQNAPGLFETADRLIYEDGYVLGLCEERQFWQDLRDASGIRGPDEGLRREVLGRFRLRPEVLVKVEELNRRGLVTAVLSDQTNWLDEINGRTPFFHHFARVFNSYRMHKGKRDPSVFLDACRELNVRPGEAVFVDDKPANIERAEAVGLRGILYRGFEDFSSALNGALEEKTPI
jgi:putative hydrolase of the HAD superfamily